MKQGAGPTLQSHMDEMKARDVHSVAAMKLQLDTLRKEM